MKKGTDRAIPSLTVTKAIYPLVKQFYQEAWQAKEQGKLICWAGVGDPRELFWAMNLVPVFPENFSAACGAKQVAGNACAIAEAHGYSRETCSYFRNTFGYMVGKDELPPPPGGGMPDPDLLILTVNSCHTRPKWWRIMERHLDVPTFILEAPTIPWDMRRNHIEPHYLDFVVEQLKELVSFIEKHTGERLNMDRLAEAIWLGDKASQLIQEVYRLRKAKPCPVGAEDMMTTIFPIIVLRGTRESVDFYEKMLQEVRERVETKTGVLAHEKFRLLVDNIPPWYTKGLYNYFHQFQALAVAETYTTTFGWESRMDPGNPWESLARSTISNWLNISFREKGEVLLQVAKDYSIDGAVFLVNRSCKVYTGSNTYLSNLLQREMGIPSLILEADQTDPRDYVDGLVKNRIDAFMEMLASR
ncbi:2-hydroxyacyl-CoA dehydratase subunit D [Calderihabitans maritimus]|uniref:Uncharacterized protein n=1 Tax=Calderihabitans maritimus TaxID=1246530 RepID=A0A1Z5HTI0_9FIRM|nr:2-hydroxyacyl-CoA dehydratase family protein [Calderihabitans maritimus]GAW92631.1 hypothetical protein KKC1_17820 [Calderihabitans maritimus]